MLRVGYKVKEEDFADCYLTLKSVYVNHLRYRTRKVMLILFRWVITIFCLALGLKINIQKIQLAPTIFIVIVSIAWYLISPKLFGIISKFNDRYMNVDIASNELLNIRLRKMKQVFPMAVSVELSGEKIIINNVENELSEGLLVSYPIKEGTKNLEFNWETIKMYRESASQFYLFLSIRQAIYIPKRGLSSYETKYIKHLLFDHSVASV